MAQELIPYTERRKNLNFHYIGKQRLKRYLIEKKKWIQEINNDDSVTMSIFYTNPRTSSNGYMTAKYTFKKETCKKQFKSRVVGEWKKQHK